MADAVDVAVRLEAEGAQSYGYWEMTACKGRPVRRIVLPRMAEVWGQDVYDILELLEFDANGTCRVRGESA